MPEDIHHHLTERGVRAGAAATGLRYRYLGALGGALDEERATLVYFYISDEVM